MRSAKILNNVWGYARGLLPTEADRSLNSELQPQVEMLRLVYPAMDVPLTVRWIYGTTTWQAFWKVTFPLARSGIATAGIFGLLTS